MNKIAGQFRKRPKFGISLAAVAAILLVATIVPIKWEKTIGYEVAIAGINKDLAMDEEKVHTLLTGLGMENAEYNVDGCEETCQLTITKLKSEDDVHIVVAAFDELGDCELKDVVPICEDETGSLMKKATVTIFSKAVVKMNTEQVNAHVHTCLDQLNELKEGEFDIWITKSDCEEGGTNVVFIADPDSDSRHLNIRTEKTDLAKFDKYFIHHITDESGEFVILENEDQTWKINLNDEEDLRKLEEFGIDIEAARLANGEFPSSIYVPKADADISGDVFIAETDDTHLKSKFLYASPGMTCSVLEVDRKADGSGLITLATEDDEVLRIKVTDMKSWDHLSVSTNGVIEVNSIDNPDEKLLIIKKGDSYYLEKDNTDVTADKSSSRIVPEQFALGQNYPNPFNPLTTVIYSLPQAEHVTLEIFNINGRKVRTLIDEIKSAGEHSVIWDSTDDDGLKVASGVYMYRLTAGEFTDAKKMTLTK